MVSERVDGSIFTWSVRRPINISVSAGLEKAFPRPQRSAVSGGGGSGGHYAAVLTSDFLPGLAGGHLFFFSSRPLRAAGPHLFPVLGMHVLPGTHHENRKQLISRPVTGPLTQTVMGCSPFGFFLGSREERSNLASRQGVAATTLRKNRATAHFLYASTLCIYMHMHTHSMTPPGGVT